MLSDRGLNSKINDLHEKAVRIANKDEIFHFKIMLEKDNAVTFHVKNLLLLIFKT